ncbi:metabolite traffic protein EboE [Catelliglobosispora koreensis]|uniref:metabolite traffic protein EboE n=1 Tax=Catelliglobosispora koreensis TaxID=129052 RepID=UPI00036A7158|nr:metabolite traffic protein EboE [Catelliglobosispora koreensis]
MRAGHLHLAYCTNVHPAEDLAGIVAQLDRFAVPVRKELGVDVLGLGLWLAAPVAAALAADAGLRAKFKHELTSRGLETVTFNGFPYEAFQAPVVKYGVYYPDWTDEQRLRYTLDLATVLADLLPDDAVRGSISTLPLAWRTPWDAERANAAHANLNALAAGLRQLPRLIRVAFEPEPGCLIETTADAITHLRPAAAWREGAGIDLHGWEGIDTGHLGVCVDLAHLACAWEEPKVALKALEEAGIPVVKAQISAALEVADPDRARAVLESYVEPRFLHQTRAQGGDAFDDLPQALEAQADGPWRVHFHAPIHAAALEPLSTSVDVLTEGIDALVAAGVDHLEVETYTWGVLPAASRPVTDRDLARGIAAELRFLKERVS